MQCSLCNTPGTRFVKARHPRYGIVYLCDACCEKERDVLCPAGRSCACDPDAVR
ncbi:MAG TPA: hypothetical protein PK089_01275 [Methanoregulaceae archaeon]|nr:hypothetical protein [Methanoregulaceae archaeon]HQJ87408.1 hypothetical protein [Methanoregulaceae archaeon]